jgi:iron(III) transport system substrate-binding protein
MGISIMSTRCAKFSEPTLKLLKPVIAAIVIAATSITSITATAETINVYSARKENLIKPLLDKFATVNDVEVNLISAGADELLKRLEVEGSASPADIFITVDAARLAQAKVAEVLQPIKSEWIEAHVPTHLQDTDKQWVGLSLRARPIFYVKNKVKPDEITTVEQLTDPKWKGRICIRSSSNVYNQSLVASLISHLGKEAATEWAKGLVANFAQPPSGGDTDQLKAAAAGVCDIAIANSYYYARLLTSDNPDNVAVGEKLGVIWPNQAEGDRGVHVNVSGAAITKASKNPEGAAKLIEFLLSPDSQEWYANVNNEYPVIPDVKVPEVLEHKLSLCRLISQSTKPSPSNLAQ